MWRQNLMVLCMVALVAAVPGTLAAQRPTPRARFERLDARSPSDSVLQAYFRDLSFTSAHGLTDEQALMVGEYPGSARYGPVVTIQPEVGLVHLSPEAFHQGRVVARIINHGSEPYERLGLPPNSVTYWWAEYYQETHRGRSVLIATDAADGRILRRLEGDLTVEPDSMRQRYQLAVARWHWTTSGERPCFPCPWGWCGFVLKF